MPPELFTDDFLCTVESLIRRHHTIYPRLPPQGLFFEAIVEQAFRLAGWSSEEVVPTPPNSPWHDLAIGGMRLSIKSETGKVTRPDRISITKLCTTEKGDWNAPALISHAIAHLGRYDKMLMLRSIWSERAFEYQLLEIPLAILAKMTGGQFAEVGTRPRRRSLAADVMDGETRMFRVHFDGADGKCQIRDLLVGLCRMLRAWRQPIK